MTGLLEGFRRHADTMQPTPRGSRRVEIGRDPVADPGPAATVADERPQVLATLTSGRRRGSSACPNPRDAEQEARASVTHNTRDHRCRAPPGTVRWRCYRHGMTTHRQATWWSRKNPPETMQGQCIGPKGERLPSTRDNNAGCPLPRQEPGRPKGHTLGGKGGSMGLRPKEWSYR